MAMTPDIDEPCVTLIRDQSPLSTCIPLGHCRAACRPDWAFSMVGCSHRRRYMGAVRASAVRLEGRVRPSVLSLAAAISMAGFTRQLLIQTFPNTML
jgi:hypothetical protein